MKKQLKVKVPTNQSEITLGQYQLWQKIIKEIGEGQEYFKQQQTVSIFCDVEIKFVKGMYHRTVKQIATAIMQVLNEEPIKFEPTFKFKGIEWGFVTDFTNLTSGEYIDITENIAEDGYLNNAMAVFFRPIEKKKHNKALGVDQYLIEPYESSYKYAKHMIDLPLDRALSVLFFLNDSMRILGSDLAAYLRKHLDQDKAMINGLPKNMDGTTVYKVLEKSMDIMTMRLQHSL